MKLITSLFRFPLALFVVLVVATIPCYAHSQGSSGGGGSQLTGTLKQPTSQPKNVAGSFLTETIKASIPNPCMFRCMGGGTEPYRYLDGRTADGTVGLAPRSGGVYTGTKWEVTYFEDGVFAFKCKGTGSGENRYLDGRTGDGSVGLAPSFGGMYSGTRWHVFQDPENGNFIARCLGANAQDTLRYLDGITANGSLILRSNYGDHLSGTRWQILPYREN